MLRHKTATYALLALYEIARQQENNHDADPPGVRASDVSDRYQLPKAYAAKILSQLSGAGVLHSDRGPHGGFRLNRPTRDISLYDVFDAVNAFDFAPAEGAAVQGLPNAVKAAVDLAWLQSADRLKELYQHTTIADILAFVEPKD